MLLKDDKDKTGVSFRPISSPKEFIDQKMDKKDIIITVALYIILCVLIGIKVL